MQKTGRRPEEAVSVLETRHCCSASYICANVHAHVCFWIIRNIQSRLNPRFQSVFRSWTCESGPSQKLGRTITEADATRLIFRS